MNRDDIIRMAREAGAAEPSSLYGRTDYVVMTQSELERFANLVAAAQREESAELAQEMIDVEYMLDDFAKSIRIGMRRLCDDGRPKWLKDSMQVAAEREACAKVCDTLQQFGDEAMFGPYWKRACVDCAEAIRARSVNNGTR